jgi:hypothetical protein
MRVLYKGIAIILVVAVVLAALPLIQGASSNKSSTPTLKVVSSSEIMILKSDGERAYLSLPTGKLLKLSVSVNLGVIGHTPDLANSVVYFAYATDNATTRYAWDKWTVNPYTGPSSIEVVATTNCDANRMPAFYILNAPAGVNGELHVAWWAEYYE